MSSPLNKELRAKHNVSGYDGDYGGTVCLRVLSDTGAIHPHPKGR